MKSDISLNCNKRITLKISLIFHLSEDFKIAGSIYPFKPRRKIAEN